MYKVDDSLRKENGKQKGEVAHESPVVVQSAPAQCRRTSEDDAESDQGRNKKALQGIFVKCGGKPRFSEG